MVFIRIQSVITVTEFEGLSCDLMHQQGELFLVAIRQVFFF